MCQYCADSNYLPTDWHSIHYGSRSIGVGITIVEATSIRPDGLVTLGDLGIWNDLPVDAHRDVVNSIAAMGSLPCVQLSHAGRKAARTRPEENDRPIVAEEGGWDIIAPSKIAFAPGYQMPRELTAPEIQSLVDDFTSSAKRAIAAGYRALELHGGHGRLIHSFLSPIANHRSDKWGGSLPNRVRFLADICAAIRSEIPSDIPLGVRLSCTDWVEGGLTIDDTIQIAKIVTEIGVDYINCSSGGIDRSVRIPTAPGYQLKFARAIKEAVGVATFGVGLIESAEQVSNAISKGDCDVVLLGRALLRNGNFAVDVLSELDASRPPEQYAKAYRRHFKPQKVLPEL